MTRKPNPFNPRIPANPKDFIGRTEELVEQGTLVKRERGKYALFHGLFKEYLVKRAE